VQQDQQRQQHAGDDQHDLQGELHPDPRSCRGTAILPGVTG
jgi:hypothetical protein